MAPAVANPLYLGYRALYKTLLEDSKRGMALALRVFVDEENFPVLVHCIHGKDRTGLIIMLLLLLCDVDRKARGLLWQISPSPVIRLHDSSSSYGPMQAMRQMCMFFF